MNQRARSILFIFFVCTSIVLWYEVLKGDEKPEPKVGTLVDAVVECQELVKAKTAPLVIDFDNAFKYQGTKALIKGLRYQVAGKITIAGKLEKPYGCLVLYKNNNYDVEVIL